MRLKVSRVELGGTSEMFRMFRSRAKHTYPVKLWKNARLMENSHQVTRDRGHHRGASLQLHNVNYNNNNYCCIMTQ